MDAPVLDASKLALQWPCRPRRGVSVVDLEKLSGDGPIRADMSGLMKVRSCNPARTDAAVGIMMANGRYAIPPTLECDRTFLHEPRDAAYLELASAILFARPGGEDVGEIFPMAMLPISWQFPLLGIPTTLDVATRVSHGVRQLLRAPVTHEELVMYRDRACAANSVSRNKSRFIDPNPFMGEFGRTPGGLDGIQFSPNVFSPLPPSHRYFAVCSGSPSTCAYRTDSCQVRFERLATAEWVLYFGVAYLHKICISGTAMVLEGGTIASMERFQGAFPPMPVPPAFTGVWPKSNVVWDDILRFARLARDAPRDSLFVRKYSVTRVEEYAVTLDPTDGTGLPESEFSVRYPHLAHGSRVGLQSETGRREADVGSGVEERTNVLDTRMTRSEFLAFAGSEGRSILYQSTWRGSTMSVRDALSACIAECTYWRGQYNRVNSSSYTGYQGQGYGQPSGSDQQAGASGYAYGSSVYRSGFGQQDEPYERR